MPRSRRPAVTPAGRARRPTRLRCSGSSPARSRRRSRASRAALKLPDDLFGLRAREGSERLRVLGAVALQLHQDLRRRLVVWRLEDLDDVVAAERHVDADEAAPGLGDDPLAVLDALAPGGQTRDALRGPTHQRHVVRHDAIMHPMRLNAYLARAGVASRRKADELIKAGRVTVNGEPGRLNTFVSSHDRVEVDGRELTKQRLAYVLLNKPAGVVTTARDPQGRLTVVDLVAGHESRLVPVGRLDADTTGALLLTNDGELAHRLAHPRYEVEKVYEAEVEGEPS